MNELAIISEGPGTHALYSKPPGESVQDLGRPLAKASDVAWSIAQDADNPTSIIVFTNDMLKLAHMELMRERELAMDRSGCHKPDDLLNDNERRRYGSGDLTEPKWLTLVYQRAYSMLNRLDRLSLGAKLELFARMEAGALYHYVGYQSLTEWLTSEADKYAPRGGYHKDLMYIATKLFPACAVLHVFESPQDMADWFRTYHNIKALRKILPAVRAVLKDQDLTNEKKRAMLFDILTIAQDPATTEAELENLANFNGAKPVLHVQPIYANGNGQPAQYLVGSMMTEDQLASLQQKVGFSTIIRSDEAEADRQLTSTELSMEILKLIRGGV